VIAAARLASYHPAIAMLSAFPVSDEDWQTMGADKMLVKPMHTRILLEQIEKLLASHEAKLSIWSTPSPKPPAAPAPAAKKIAARRPAAKRLAGKGSKPNPKTGKSSARKPAAKRATKASKR
jgi:DNA-binding response OmpR family regulator